LKVASPRIERQELPVQRNSTFMIGRRIHERVP
jgi:hypothetical protein